MKRLFCLALLLCLFSGCGAVPDAGLPDGGGPETATVAYIPLDDRPVNTTRVELLAQSAGFRLLMPEKHLYRTVLDGQPLNPNGTQYGDGEKLLEWLENIQADYYVISVDQILSGGLVNSRWMGEITDEPRKIQRLLAVLEGKQAILFDTVMRLAPTVGYGGCTLEEYRALRAYGQLPRPELSGELTVDRVIAGYAVTADLDGTVICDYLAARSRKLKLSGYLLSTLEDRENISVYCGIDDSSPENTVQTSEIAFLRQKLKRGHIFAGTDEMGLMAVTRVIGQHYGAQAMPRVSIRYFGADPQAPADAYDVGSLESNVLTHLAALNAQPHRTEFELELLVYGGDGPEALLAHYKKNQEKGMPTMIVDIGEDFSLPGAMAADGSLDFSCLLSYSSWNTAGNSVGIALSNGIARYLYLKNAPSPVRGTNSAFLQGLALSFAKDVSYARVKSQIRPEDPRQALEAVRQGWGLSFEKLAAMLEGKHFLVSLAPTETGTIPGLAVTDISFPWHRSFEAELDIRIEE